MRAAICLAVSLCVPHALSAQEDAGTIDWILDRHDQPFHIHVLGELTFKDKILLGDPTLLDDGYYFPTLTLPAPATATYVTMTDAQFGDLTKAILLFSDAKPTCGVSFGRTEEMRGGVFMDPDRIKAIEPLAKEAAASPDMYWTELGLWPDLTKEDNWSAIVTLEDGTAIPAYSNWDSGYYPVYAFYDDNMALTAFVMDHFPTSRGEVDMPPACR